LGAVRWSWNAAKTERTRCARAEALGNSPTTGVRNKMRGGSETGEMTKRVEKTAPGRKTRRERSVDLGGGDRGDKRKRKKRLAGKETEVNDLPINSQWILKWGIMREK